MKKVSLKVLPPLASSSKSVEVVYSLPESAKLIDLLLIAERDGVLKVESIVNENGEIRDGIVVLINGRNAYDLNQQILDGDRVVVLPLAPGG